MTEYIVNTLVFLFFTETDKRQVKYEYALRYQKLGD